MCNYAAVDLQKDCDYLQQLLSAVHDIFKLRVKN